MMSFEDLHAWKQARLLVRNAYELCRDTKLGKDWELKDQIQRASVSVMTNIAEGFERTGTQEKLHFYNIARASCGEVRSLLYIVEDNFPHLAAQAIGLRNSSIGVGKLITGLFTSTKNRKSPNIPATLLNIAIPIYQSTANVL
jgi:four helix bundle protein